MSFRKRNVGITSTSFRARPTPDHIPSTSSTPHLSPPGVRPSFVDGRPTTSTGTSSLDELLAGHGGLALGTSILMEENGTTDYAGTLLRYYAAEGVVQGHTVHVVGVGEPWARQLPGLLAPLEGSQDERARGKEKMKVAWRYEGQGDFGAGLARSRVPPSSPALERSPAIDAAPSNAPPAQTPFCHSFDLTKRLAIPSPSPLRFVPLAAQSPDRSPFLRILQNLNNDLANSPPGSVHRLIIPTLLSPLIYPPHASQPHHLLQFLHALRGMLRQHSAQLTAMLTLPLDLYPRSSGLVRWMELLSDGVIELTPFLHSSPHGSVGGATAQEEQPQGMLHIHRLPIFHERGGDGGGGGSSGLGENLAFTVSRRRFVIKPFSLPPVEGDIEAQQGGAEDKPALVDLEF